MFFPVCRFLCRVTTKFGTETRFVRQLRVANDFINVGESERETTEWTLARSFIDQYVCASFMLLCTPLFTNQFGYSFCDPRRLPHRHRKGFFRRAEDWMHPSFASSVCRPPFDAHSAWSSLVLVVDRTVANRFAPRKQGERLHEHAGIWTCGNACNVVHIA